MSTIAPPLQPWDQHQSGGSAGPLDCYSWQVVASPNGATVNNYLYSAEAVSANDVWAVGDYSNVYTSRVA